MKLPRKYWLFGLAIMLSIFLTSLFIMSFPKAVLTVSIGFAMIAFSLTQMFGAKIPLGHGRKWHVGVGLFSGVLGGLSSIWSPPVAMYLLAHNVSKAEFIGATGFLVFGWINSPCRWPDLCWGSEYRHGSSFPDGIDCCSSRLSRWRMASRPCSAGFISPDRVMGVFDHGRATYRRWFILIEY